MGVLCVSVCMILLEPVGLDSRNVAPVGMARGQYLAVSKA